MSLVTSTFLLWSWRRSSESYLNLCSPSGSTATSRRSSVSPAHLLVVVMMMMVTKSVVIVTVFLLPGVESSLRVTRCKQIVESLPEHQFIVVKYLLCFLHKVRQVFILLCDWSTAVDECLPVCDWLSGVVYLSVCLSLRCLRRASWTGWAPLTWPVCSVWTCCGLVTAPSLSPPWRPSTSSPSCSSNTTTPCSAPAAHLHRWHPEPAQQSSHISFLSHNTLNPNKH